MRCKQCEYRLWNLRSRNCPECGAPFSPGDYTFVPNAVRFLCPHCGQAYYGTDEKGHLVPSSFQCVSCRAAIDMSEMVLQPAEGIEEDATRPQSVPWLERDRHGFFRGWYRTVGWVIASPRKLASRLPADARRKDAWSFLLLNTVVAALGLVFPIAFSILMVSMIPGGNPPIGVVIVSYAVMILLSIPMTLVWMYLWSACIHGVLRIGCTPRGRFAVTQEAVFYSSGISVLNAVPCIGPYVAPLWSLVVAAIMVRERQGVGGWRASLAVLSLPLLACGGFIAIYALLIWSVMNAAGPAGFGGINSAQTRDYASSAAVTLISFTEGKGGVWPAHAAELLLPGNSSMTGDTLLLPDSETFSDDAFIGKVSLDRFDAMNETQMRQVVDAAVKALPPDVIAHRLGDFVFTYHGINYATGHDRLWILLAGFDPDANGDARNRSIGVVTKKGRVKIIEPADWSAELVKQNTLRAEAGLAPLPDPWTVRHSKPARAADAATLSPASREKTGKAELPPEAPSPPPPEP